VRADATLQRARLRLAAEPPPGAVAFDGSRASQLNRLLRDPNVRAIRVRSDRLVADEPIRIARGPVWLDFGGASIRPPRADSGPRFALRIEDASDVTVDGGRFVGGDWAVLVRGGRDVLLRGQHVVGARRGGIVVTGGTGAVVAGATLVRIEGAPILLHGGARGTALLDNEIVDNRGTSNWHAGIVVTDRTASVDPDPDALLEADRHWIREQRIDARLAGPRDTVVAFNRILRNASSGIYADGGVQNVYVGNTIEANAKEGMCLDNGASANVVAHNAIRGNGKRWGQTDDVLRRDFVLASGRLADGTSPAKTPGLSIDNAAHNIVHANVLDRNWGGGIKMVRTAFFNRIGLNVLTDNAEGRNERFHFFGIELGAAPADGPVSDLDFTSSRGNLVWGNTVRGAHYAGLFFGAGSTDNDAFDNSVFGATAWALEQVRPQANASLNNLSNLPSRNIGSGLDPKLPQQGKARQD
jgi:parallel beta-helix repeat protein